MAEALTISNLPIYCGCHEEAILGTTKIMTKLYNAEIAEIVLFLINELLYTSRTKIIYCILANIL